MHPSFRPLTPLSKRQLAACRHPFGRLIYYTAGLLVVASVIFLTILLSPSLGFHKDVSRGFLADELENIGTTVSASPSTPDSSEMAASHMGVWVFEQADAPWKTMILTQADVQLREPSIDPKPMAARLQQGYLLVERVQDGRLQTLATPLSFDSKGLVLEWNGARFTAVRDADQSIPILLNNTFKDLPYIASGLIHGLEVWQVMATCLALLAFIMLAKMAIYTQTQSRGIKLSPQQFPKAYTLYENMARQMGFTKTPEIYLVNGQGSYNAYASCVTGYRKFTCVHAEIFHAYEIGGDEKAFMMIMAHELGHLRLGHTGLLKTIIGFILNFIPLLGQAITSAYGRAFEYEADRMSLHFVNGREAAQSYLMLHSSRLLYSTVDLQSYRNDSYAYSSIGMFWENLKSSHPIGPWRVDALCHCKVGGLFVHRIEPSGDATAPRARQIFNAYRESH